MTIGVVPMPPFGTPRVTVAAAGDELGPKGGRAGDALWVSATGPCWVSLLDGPQIDGTRISEVALGPGVWRVELSADVSLTSFNNPSATDALEVVAWFERRARAGA